MAKKKESKEGMRMVGIEMNELDIRRLNAMVVIEGTTKREFITDLINQKYASYDERNLAEELIKYEPDKMRSVLMRLVLKGIKDATKKDKNVVGKKETLLFQIAKELQETLKIKKKPDSKGSDDYFKKYILAAAANIWPEDEISEDAQQVLKDMGFDLEAQLDKVRGERAAKEAEESSQAVKSKPKKKA